MKQYLDDLLVWSVILAVIVPTLMALLRRRWIFIVIFGALLSISSVFIVGLTYLSSDFGNSSPEAYLTWILGVVIAISGILIVIFSKKLAKK